MKQSGPPIEKELKYFLDKSSYLKLLRHFRKDICGKTKQANIFFDNSHRQLHKKKIGLRIRIENKKKATLTLKEPRGTTRRTNPALAIRKEWETTLPIQVAHDLISGKRSFNSLKHRPIQILKRHLSKDAIELLAPLGSLHTQRTLVKMEQGFLLEIDTFKLFGTPYYELEIETQNALLVDQWVKTQFKKLGILYRPISQSKLSRFLKALKKRNLQA